MFPLTVGRTARSLCVRSCTFFVGKESFRSTHSIILCEDVQYTSDYCSSVVQFENALRFYPKQRTASPSKHRGSAAKDQKAASRAYSFKGPTKVLPQLRMDCPSHFTTFLSDSRVKTGGPRQVSVVRTQSVSRKQQMQRKDPRYCAASAAFFYFPRPCKTREASLSVYTPPTSRKESLVPRKTAGPGPEAQR